MSYFFMLRAVIIWHIHCYGAEGYTPISVYLLPLGPAFSANYSFVGHVICGSASCENFQWVLNQDRTCINGLM